MIRVTVLLIHLILISSFSFGGEVCWLMSTSEFVAKASQVRREAAEKFGLPAEDFQPLRHHFHRMEGIPFEQFWAYSFEGGSLKGTAGYFLPDRDAYLRLVNTEVARRRTGTFSKLKTTLEDHGNDRYLVSTPGTAHTLEEVRTSRRGPDGKVRWEIVKEPARTTVEDFHFVYDRGVALWGSKSAWESDIAAIARVAQPARGKTFYVSLNLNAIAKSDKKALLKNVMQAARFNMRQLDTESKIVYELRKAFGEQILALLDLAVNDLVAVSYGYEYPTDEKPFQYTVSVTAEKNSQLDRLMRGLRGRPQALVETSPFEADSVILNGYLHSSIPNELQELLALYLNSAETDSSRGKLMFHGLLRDLCDRQQIEARLQIGKDDHGVPGIVVECQTQAADSKKAKYGPYPAWFDISKELIPFPNLKNTVVLKDFFVDAQHGANRMRIGVNPLETSVHTGGNLWPAPKKNVIAELNVDFRHWGNEKPGSHSHTILRGVEWALDALREYKVPPQLKLDLLEFEGDDVPQKNKSPSFIKHITQEGSYFARSSISIQNSTLTFDTTIGRDLFLMLEARKMVSPFSF